MTSLKTTDIFNDFYALSKRTLPEELLVHAAYFAEYAGGFFSGPEQSPEPLYTGAAESSPPQIRQNNLPLRLKVEHSAKVLENASRILAYQPARPNGIDFRDAALLAALYHDIGRFEQYTRWQTFTDTKSINHGQLACRILKANNFLEHVAPWVRRQVLTAVCLHNARSIPSGLHQDCLPVLKLLRDADKLDIFRVMAEELRPGNISDPAVVMHTCDVPGAYTPEILRHVRSGCTGSFTELRYLNDLRMLLGSWVFDLNYPASIKILSEDGNYARVLAGLPQELPEIAELCAFLSGQL